MDAPRALVFRPLVKGNEALGTRLFMRGNMHSRPQRPRSFWSAPKITTSGQVQRHFGFEWLCKHNRLRPEPIRFVRLDYEHAQSKGKSVKRGLPETVARFSKAPETFRARKAKAKSRTLLFQSCFIQVILI